LAGVVVVESPHGDRDEAHLRGTTLKTCNSVRLMTSTVTVATARTHPAKAFPSCPESAQISLSRVQVFSDAMTNSLAPIRSPTPAAVTTTASRNRSTTTAMWRFLPLISCLHQPASGGSRGIRAFHRLGVHSGEILHRVAAGETLTVTRDGEPIVAHCPADRCPQASCSSGGGACRQGTPRGCG
jgi:hypothetical protein